MKKAREGRAGMEEQSYAKHRPDLRDLISIPKSAAAPVHQQGAKSLP